MDVVFRAPPTFLKLGFQESAMSSSGEEGPLAPP